MHQAATQQLQSIPVIVEYPELHPEIAPRVAKAQETITEVLVAGTHLLVSWSGGKDSCCVLSLVLTTAAALAQAGSKFPTITIVHGDTGVDNPEVHGYAHREMGKIRAFAREHGFSVKIHIARPSVAASWAYRHIGAGKTPTFYNKKQRDCAVDLKVVPINRLKKKLYAHLGKEETLSLLGTRFAESTTRAENMQSRRESDTTPWVGDDDYRYLSPIANWSTRDVWRYLDACLQRQVTTYSDMEDCFRIYEDAAGTTCSIEADLALGKLKQSRGCGARHGCWSCVAVKDDTSMTAMLESDPDYAYMRGLNQLQKFLLATQYDWDRREPIGRTINKAGYVTIQPDTYSASMREELLRYCLTLDRRELIASQEAGLSEPRFEIITIEALIAIDAEWSRQGLFGPFHAMKIYRDIFVDGEEYDIPKLEPIPRTPLPAPRYVYVGNDWDEGEEYAYTGLRNPMYEAFAGGCIEGDMTRPISNGQCVTNNFTTEDQFTIDLEGAEFVMMDMNHLIDTYHDDPFYRATYGYQHYLTLGTFSLAKSQVSKADAILRRTAFRERHGLTGDNIDLDAFMARSISAKEMKQILDGCGGSDVGVVEAGNVGMELWEQDSLF